VHFSLVVDNLGVKYVGKEHAEHLVTTLKKNYEVTTDWEGKTFCGMHFMWNYEKRYFDLSMPGYIQKSLQCFSHPTPKATQDSPHPFTPPIYGAKQQVGWKAVGDILA
jgi:hypothetical protein